MMRVALCSAGIAVLVCLPFTGGKLAWADPAQLDDPMHTEYVEDPYAPHDTSGSEIRVGTAVGFLYAPVRASALGFDVAGGRRFGRFTIEAEYQYLSFHNSGLTETSLGAGNRIGAMARLDVLRIGPRWVGANSLLSFYVEGGAAVAMDHWTTPGSNEPARLVPDDSKHVEGQLGFGLELEHRLQEPPTFPHRIGWFLGWRYSIAAPQTMMASTVCRGSECRTTPMTPDDSSSYTDRSMVFQSSLQFTW